MDETDDRNGGNQPEKPQRARAAEAERQAQARRERAAKTLRENLLRRKQQGRARRAGDADERSNLPVAASDEPVKADDQADAAVNSHESRE